MTWFVTVTRVFEVSAPITLVREPNDLFCVTFATSADDASSLAAFAADRHLGVNIRGFVRQITFLVCMGRDKGH